MHQNQKTCIQINDSICQPDIGLYLGTKWPTTRPHCPDTPPPIFTYALCSQRILEEGHVTHVPLHVFQFQTHCEHTVFASVVFFQ